MATYFAQIVLLDDYGRTTRKSFKSQSDLADFAAAQAALTALVTDLQGVTQLGVLRTYLTEETAVGEAPAATANKDEGMTITVQKENTKRASIKVPAPTPGLILDDGSVDIANVLLTDYIANFQLAGDWTVSDGEIVDSIVKGSLDE